MHTRCIFCRGDLGANEVIESFPVGRRLAFDAAKGRLWVVCPSCAQWNLTPVEARWEAVEACERRFRDAKVRMQGEQVGMARLPEGLELVRIGRPVRLELNTWRYGDQFRLRRRLGMIGSIAAGAATGTALIAGAPMLLPVLLTPALVVGTLISQAGIIHHARQGITRLPHPDGGEVLVTPNERGFIRLVERAEGEGGWGLDVPYARKVLPGDPWWRTHLNLPAEGTARYAGAGAQAAAARLLTSGRKAGARPKLITEAVSLIEEAGSSEAWFRSAAKQTRKWAADASWGDTGAVWHLPKPVRLALEMAAHEETERRALEGELAELEARWREAEEVAAIADDMFLPASVTRFLARFNSGPT